MEVPKFCDTAMEEGQKKGQGRSVDSADVHAMKNLMNRNVAAGELSAIFSAQLNRNSQAKKEPGRQPGKPGQADAGKIEGHIRDDSGGGHQKDDRPDTSELAKEVADQILVSDPAYLISGAENEVRIKIKESILKDAHIHLKRVPPRLEVRLLTGDPHSAMILETAEPALADQLKTNFAGQIDIKTVYLDRKKIHETS